jgi:ribosomal protein L7/L12
MSVEQQLMEMSMRLARLEGEVQDLYRRLKIPYGDEAAHTDERILEPLRRGNLIEAIKVYREIYNVGLAEAKQAVESMRTRDG